MLRFLVCSTDEQTFDNHIVGQFPAVGIAERFVMPEYVFIFDKTMAPIMDDEMLVEELAELGITLLSIV